MPKMKSNFILLVILIVLVGVSYHVERVGTLEQRVDNLESIDTQAVEGHVFTELCPDCGYAYFTDSWCEHHMRLATDQPTED